MTDAGGLRTRRRAEGRELCFNKAKLIPVLEPRGSLLAYLLCMTSTPCQPSGGGLEA